MSPVSLIHGWIDTPMLQVNINMGDFPVVNWRQGSLRFLRFHRNPLSFACETRILRCDKPGNATPIDDALKGAPKWKHKPMMRPRIKGKDLKGTDCQVRKKHVV